MRFNPSEVTLREVVSHQCDYSLLDIYIICESRISQGSGVYPKFVRFSEENLED